MKKIVALLALCLEILTAFPSWAAATDTTPSPNGERLFRVYVSDDDGPVKDIAVQFCDDTVCNIGKTNVQGLAAFDMPEGKCYEIHVLKVPAGYEMNTEVFKTLDVYCDVLISLKKSK
ncbi:MAG: hypothetical protein K5841_07455 [Fretibacterium sp.]|nr:hypothetical protein [Fretibacterium sp.]